MSVIDINRMVAAKSDQLNADDLVGGARTIRIRDIVETGAEQPLAVFFDGDDGKAWKPSKTAIRCLAAVWGTDAARWIGLSCTIYSDPTVKWGGVAVGGIRVSHAEGLTEPRRLMLAVTRGKKQETIIQPLAVAQGPVAKWRERLFAVAGGGTGVTVADAWAKVPGKVRAELGEGLYDQLLALERASAEHAASDDAQLDALNAAVTAA